MNDLSTTRTTRDRMNHARELAAEQKPTLTDMIRRATDESLRIEQTQEALLEAGLRAVPHAEEMARAATFEAIAKLLAKIDAKRDQVAKVLRGNA